MQENSTLKLRNYWFIPLVLSLLISRPGMSQETEVLTEYQVKAAFLLSLTNFVEWPTDAFYEQNQPLVIAVVGENPFDSLLEEAVQGRMLENHPIEIRRLATIDKIDNIHMLFVSKSETRRIEQIITQTINHPILTIADMDQSDCKGIMVVMSVSKDNKLKFAINNDRVNKAKLQISSRVLRFADIIQD
jgi:hypothetical protein